ncbi:MAG: succinylglutamate desuccinylase [Burkholderiales bacterium]|nr:MAG: succinylglutamate desuccinylase [Betaproteobacteria bacterium]TAG84034.1 MAG: succinylglutamate desuccinylase [Burkholderiales bacterium]
MTEPVLEVVFPNLKRWAAGNAGIPYVWSFESGIDGPHVCINALVHGNEVCGAIAVNELLNAFETGAKLARGKLTAVFANVAAYESFDPKRPFDSRCVEEDFNRLWNESTLNGDRQSRELVRARELRALYDSVDHLLDLHSMLEPAPPIALAGDTEKGLALARAIGTPAHILVDSGHAAGKRLRDYAAFAEPRSPKSALLVECGQHWERNVGQVACNVVRRFLRHFETFDRAWLDSLIDPEPLPAQRVVEISEVVTPKSEQFSWARPLRGLEVIAEAGTLLATDGAREVRTPHADAVMVMPVPHSKVGQTAVRIGRLR